MLQDGELLSSFTSNVSIDNQGHHLTIPRAQSMNSGNYTCLATNAAGTTNLTTVLTVIAPPSWNSVRS